MSVFCSVWFAAGAETLYFSFLNAGCSVPPFIGMHCSDLCFGKCSIHHLPPAHTATHSCKLGLLQTIGFHCFRLMLSNAAQSRWWEWAPRKIWIGEDFLMLSKGKKPPTKPSTQQSAPHGFSSFLDLKNLKIGWFLLTFVPHLFWSLKTGKHFRPCCFGLFSSMWLFFI